MGLRTLHGSITSPFTNKTQKYLAKTQNLYSFCNSRRTKLQSTATLTIQGPMNRTSSSMPHCSSHRSLHRQPCVCPIWELQTTLSQQSAASGAEDFGDLVFEFLGSVGLVRTGDGAKPNMNPNC
ncbi:hypothetical protein ACFX2F_004247 [Malus domestica]